MGIRRAVLAAILLVGCESDGTVNNGGVVQPVTLRASLASDGREGNAAALSIHLSADGRRIAFSSKATNLHPDDRDVVEDVYVKDLATGELFLASRADGAAGAKGGFDAQGARISGDGRRVVFSTQSALDPVKDTDGLPDIYLRELDTGRTWLVSVSSSGEKGEGFSEEPDLSYDGTIVAFASTARNLSTAGSSWKSIYHRNLEAGTTEYLSMTYFGGVSSGDSEKPRVSADGLRVAFISKSTSLVDPPTSSAVIHAFHRDLQVGQTRLVSRADGPDGAEANAHAFEMALSSDGRSVVFACQATNLGSGGGATEIYLRDVDRDRTEMLSAASSGLPTGASSRYPDVSENGRFVSFSSRAASLGEGDANSLEDVYVRDRLFGLTFRGSLRTFGGELNGPSLQSSLSADGRFLGFLSRASDAVEDDGNSLADAFVRGPLR